MFVILWPKLTSRLCDGGLSDVLDCDPASALLLRNAFMLVLFQSIFEAAYLAEGRALRELPYHFLTQIRMAIY